MPERDPQAELTARLWSAHAAYEERNQRRLSQARIAKEVAELAGVTVDQTTVGTWFKGSPPKPWFLQPLADVLEVRFVWLVTGEGSVRDEFIPDFSKTPAPQRAGIKRERHLTSRKNAKSDADERKRGA